MASQAEFITEQLREHIVGHPIVGIDIEHEPHQTRVYIRTDDATLTLRYGAPDGHVLAGWQQQEGMQFRELRIDIDRLAPTRAEDVARVYPHRRILV